MKAKINVDVTIDGKKHLAGATIDIPEEDEWLIDQGLAVKVAAPKPKKDET